MCTALGLRALQLAVDLALIVADGLTMLSVRSSLEKRTHYAIPRRSVDVDASHGFWDLQFAPI